MSGIADIREALAAAVAANVTLSGGIGALQCSAWQLANPTPPTCHVIGPSIDYDATGTRGIDDLTFRVQAFVGATLDESSQRLVAELQAAEGAGSIKAALELDRTLGGLIDDLRVISCSEPTYYVFDAGRGAALGIEFAVEMTASGEDY